MTGNERPQGNADSTLPGWSDVFDNQVSDRTNVLDLASHYPYNPERWTVRVDGTRQLIQYGSISQYNHAGDVHELTPAGGETVVLESAERPRYVVQYELASTMAFALNQSLNSGDNLIIGLYDGSDGWYMEHDGSHNDDQADFVMERGGSEVYRKTDQDLRKGVQTFARLRLLTGWYDITRQKWDRSFTDNGEQKNEEIGSYSADGSKGPNVGNLPIRFEITADAGTSGLRLDAGSCAQVNLGRTVPLRRFKTAIHTDSIDATGTWVPLRAYRVDPDRDITNVQVRDIDIGKYSVSDDVEVLCVACDPSKVKDSGGNALVDGDFSTPNEFNAQNNVLESTGVVEQIPDNTGTVGTSATNPGGWELARGELYDASGNEVSGTTSTAVEIKRPLYARDFMIILGKSGSTGDVTYQIEFEQDW